MFRDISTRSAQEVYAMIVQSHKIPVFFESTTTNKKNFEGTSPLFSALKILCSTKSMLVLKILAKLEH